MNIRLLSFSDLLRKQRLNIFVFRLIITTGIVFDKFEIVPTMYLLKVEITEKNC